MIKKGADMNSKDKDDRTPVSGATGLLFPERERAVARVTIFLRNKVIPSFDLREDIWLKDLINILSRLPVVV